MHFQSPPFWWLMTNLIKAYKKIFNKHCKGKQACALWIKFNISKCAQATNMRAPPKHVHMREIRQDNNHMHIGAPSCSFLDLPFPSCITFISLPLSFPYWISSSFPLILNFSPPLASSTEKGQEMYDNDFWRYPSFEHHIWTRSMKLHKRGVFDMSILMKEKWCEDGIHRR